MSEMAGSLRSWGECLGADSPQEALPGTRPCWTADPQTSSTQAQETHFYSFKLLSLWEFVVAAPRNPHARLKVSNVQVPSASPLQLRKVVLEISPRL